MNFECSHCGKCCGDTEEKIRHILLLKSDIDRISKETLLNYTEFAEKSTGTEPYIYELKKTKSGSCFFLKNNLCIIYEIRPLICRFYPFPLENLGNNKHAFSFTKKCPGIGKGSLLKKTFFQKLFNQMLKAMEKTTINKNI
ncbi:MAG: YkgJ family cysteine cluster protein [Candidatus Bathyarchaeota archaeon]